MEKDIRVRIASVQDAKALLNIYAPYVEKTAITFEDSVPSTQAFSNRIERVLKKYPYLVAEGDGRILGFAYAAPFRERSAYDWAVETTIYVDENWKRMGIGKTLYESLEAILAVQNILNLNACIAVSAEEDEYLTKDSLSFHRYFGYRLVGEFYQCGYKFNRWYNMVWMEKHIGAHVEKQPIVRRFDAVKERIGKTFGGDQD